MAGVPVGNSLQIVLMFRFRLPEIARRRDLRHDLSGPQTGCLDVRNRVLGDSPLFIAALKDLVLRAAGITADKPAERLSTAPR